MGGTDSKQEVGGQHEYERFGPVKISEITDPQNGDTFSLMQFSKPIENENALNLWTKQISRIDDSETRETLLLPDKHIFEKAGLCGSNGHVQLTYENFPYVLDSEIKNRKKLNRYFIETEMWYLLYNIIRAANKFEKINKKIGDVNPHNVIINDDGQTKVISTCSIPGESTNFEKIIEDKHAKVYLAPEELNDEFIAKCQYPSSVDPCKAEVFSIGLTILSSAVLEDCFDIYNMPARTINTNLLNKHLESLRQHYSPYLFNTILSMLSLDPRQRRKSSDIYNELYPNQNRILQLEEFNGPYQAGQASRYSQPQPQVQHTINTTPVYLNNQIPPGHGPVINYVHPGGYPVNVVQGPRR